MYTVVLTSADLGQTSAVEVDVVPESACWRLNGPGELVENGCGFGRSTTCRPEDSPGPGYQAGIYLSLVSRNFVLSRETPQQISGIYRRQTGTVKVTTLPPGAPWRIRDADGQPHAGAGDAQLPGLPTGSTGIFWDPVPNYDAPAGTTVTKTLENNATVSFLGIYGSRIDGVENRMTGLLRYLLGIDNNPNGMDTNADQQVDIADYVHTLEGAPPENPSVPDPADGATSTPISLMLNWNDAKYALWYDVWVWPTNEAQPTTATVTGLTQSQTFVNLQQEKQYDRRVRARNRIRESWGGWWRLTTRREDKAEPNEPSAPPPDQHNPLAADIPSPVGREPVESDWPTGPAPP